MRLEITLSGIGREEAQRRIRNLVEEFEARLL